MHHTTTTNDVREIESLPNYGATSSGEIISLTTGRALTARPHGDRAYLHVQPRVDGKQKKLAVHRLVAEAFHGPRPAGQQTRHLNGVKADCSAANLTYGTARQNYGDSIDHGTAIGANTVGLVGELHPAHRLREEVVEDVLLFVGFGDSQRSVGERFGLSQGMVSRIVRGLNWAHVARSPSMRAKVTVAA